MKRVIFGIMAAMCMTGTMTAYAAEPLDKDYIEERIWEDFWVGKSDDGTQFPEASFKHHLLEDWIDENYGNSDYDWSSLGGLRYNFRDYYEDYIEGWDFEDDGNGNWKIQTEQNTYHFVMLDNNWQMIDQNSVTVDSFPPFSTMEEETTTQPSTYVIQDDGGDSNRVVGKIEAETQTATEMIAENKNDSAMNPMTAILCVAGAVGIGAVGFYVMRKKK